MATANVLPYFRNMGPDEESFADRLKRLVDGKRADGVSAAAIARKAHISKAQMSNLMTGTSWRPNVDTLEGLAYALGVDRDYLWLGKQPEPEMNSMPQFLGWLNQERDALLRNAEAVITAEARRLADRAVAAERHRLDEEWHAVLHLLDADTARRVRAARDEVAIRGADAPAPHRGDPFPVQPHSSPNQARIA